MTSKDHTVSQFLQALKSSHYQGEIFTDKAMRLIHATDNSIYQIMPQAIIAPRTQNDLAHILTIGKQYPDIAFMPRGGGTGTNGQALNDCIIVDTSKHLTEILEINVKDKWVRAQPGVTLDQLNNALIDHNLFFPPHVSPSKSATIGGMVSTDACGKGSRIYGKTGDYILNMRCFLANGKEIKTAQYQDSVFNTIISKYYKNAVKTVPNLPRGISGYNLRAYNPTTNMLDMNKLIAGSEGSLALIAEIKLRIVPKPKHSSMFCVSYDCFDTALRQVSTLLEHNPITIETIDDRILELARDDVLWQDVQNILPNKFPSKSIKAIHFIEFESHTKRELQDKQTIFKSFLDTNPHNRGYALLEDISAITQASALRSKCVGLLGNMEGMRRPIPFIEDTAVPPENLANYIVDLKALLSRHNLTSSAFGHVDVGCLHVRPALDLRQREDAVLIRTLSDEVVQLLKKHDGVLWGEHGKGMRGEYTSQLLGTPYYKAMQAIKTYLDPHNKFNPGKISAPEGTSVRTIDSPPFRGEFDRQIEPAYLNGFEKSVQCNGNGLCFSAMQNDMMCPSYKVTRDRRHSPKGRAGLLREWLRLKSVSPIEARAFEPNLYEIMTGCLSCKACTSICPIHVNIPDMKTAFLEHYFQSRIRKTRDYLIANAELLSYYLSHWPFTPPSIFGLVDMPKSSRPTLQTLMKRGGFKFATAENVQKNEKPILIVQDAYTSAYHPNIVIAALKFLKKLGFSPFVLPFRQSGKSWHTMGFLKTFRKISARNSAYYQAFNAPLIGIDPSITLTYRDEYKNSTFKVWLLDEWLVQNLPNQQKKIHEHYKLFLHCTESTMLPSTKSNWVSIFKKFGIDLQPIKTGCCGMAGAYGHMQEHKKKSLDLYDMSWKGTIDKHALVTGYSCRSQIKRCENLTTRHPIEILDQYFQTLD